MGVARAIRLISAYRSSSLALRQRKLDLIRVILFKADKKNLDQTFTELTAKAMVIGSPANSGDGAEDKRTL